MENIEEETDIPPLCEGPMRTNDGVRVQKPGVAYLSPSPTV